MEERTSWYEHFNIHDLRKMARAIGIPNPTIYKKKDLIKKMQDVEQGKIKPCFSKKGRPVSKEIKKDNLDRYKAKIINIINGIRELLYALEKEIID